MRGKMRVMMMVRVMVMVMVREAAAGEVHVRHPGRVREGGPGRGAGEETSRGGDDARRRRRV